jgi:hypothetical protein
VVLQYNVPRFSIFQCPWEKLQAVLEERIALNTSLRILLEEHVGCNSVQI